MTDEQDKPRRLEEETVNYLKQIDIQYTDKIDDEEKTILVENVLTEIKTRTASALCDRNTNYLMEKMCFGASLTTLVEILQRCTQYALFLSRNRYSSHVIQTIIARLCYILKYEDYGNFEQSLDVVSTTILDFVTPIMKEISWLSKDLSATHVLRSIACLLAGIPIVSEKKGKGSKHAHSVSLAQPIETLLEPGAFYISASCSFGVPVAFHALLLSTVRSLALGGVSARELQLLIADSSGAAVLSLLVRILSNPDLVGAGSGAEATEGGVAESGPEILAQLFGLALEISPPRLDSSSPCPVFYAMAGDRSGSYFLESVIECCPVSFLLGLIGGTSLCTGEPTGVFEYADDNCGNFVLQAVLRRLTSELDRELAFLRGQVKGEGSDSSGGSSSDRGGKWDVQTAIVEIVAVERLLVAFTGGSAALARQQSNPQLETLVTARGGLTLWLLEIATRYEKLKAAVKEASVCSSKSLSKRAATVVFDSSLDDFSRTFGHRVMTLWVRSNAVDDESAAETGVSFAHLDKKLAAYLNDKFATPAAESSSLAEKAEKPDKAGPAGPPSRDTPNLLLARQMAALMRSNCDDVSVTMSKAMALLSTDTIHIIATSGPLSRQVMDTFFAIFSKSRPGDIRNVNASLSAPEHALTLAQHYVGQHVLKKSYELCDLRGREKWVQSLTGATAGAAKATVKPLTATKEGRNTLSLVHADLYARDATEWRALVKKQLKAGTILQDLSTTAAAAASTTSTCTGNVVAKKEKAAQGAESSAGPKEGATAADDPLAGGVAVDATLNKRGRKRKRKRGGNKSQSAGGGGDEGSGGEGSGDDDA